MIYRKRGSVVRWENGTSVRVIESGVGVEEGELFACEPTPGDPLPMPHADFPALEFPVTVERLIMTRGVAEHEYGEKRWREESERLHLSLVHGRERALLDQADLDLAHIRRVAGALSRIGEEREAPSHLRLAPNVTAALLPTLAVAALPGVRVVQTAGGVDGKGTPIVEAEHDWPNWYRPSYRIRPLRAPLNLRLESAVTAIDESLPVAIAFLAPPAGLTVRLLVEDGGRAWPCTLRLTRIAAVSSQRKWYPYGGGSFGAELML